ncbi:hypothetical protein GQ53DRAFT_745607 [Thozetella sp. PMI_491]|nr:hypothetical protein GQ53DRAFT_745607 [Thozetella sp. PMI_491]
MRKEGGWRWEVVVCVSLWWLAVAANGRRSARIVNVLYRSVPPAVWNADAPVPCVVGGPARDVSLVDRLALAISLVGSAVV